MDWLIAWRAVVVKESFHNSNTLLTKRASIVIDGRIDSIMMSWRLHPEHKSHLSSLNRNPSENSQLFTLIMSTSLTPKAPELLDEDVEITFANLKVTSITLSVILESISVLINLFTLVNNFSIICIVTFSRKPRFWTGVIVFSGTFQRRKFCSTYSPCVCVCVCVCVCFCSSVPLSTKLFQPLYKKRLLLF